jgi:hypothetical protein
MNNTGILPLLLYGYEALSLDFKGEAWTEDV